MSDDTEYKMADAFYIDDGELDGISPESAFCLGVEWANVRSLLLASDTAEFTTQIHEANRERVTKMIANHNRECTVELKDANATWLEITVTVKPLLRLI